MVSVDVRRSRPKPSAVYDAYWKFAAERQEVFFRRIEGKNPPWTHDPVLKLYKFTNAYRAADRVSQFLIRRVIYEGPQESAEVFFRCILFKIFNRESTWEFLKKSLPVLEWKSFAAPAYDSALGDAKQRGHRIFSAAYIMPSRGRGLTDPSKHRNFLAILQRMMLDEAHQKVSDCKSMGDAFAILRSYPLIGDFLAYQFVTDLNYSPLTNFSETEFVMAGPGARNGIRKCFSDFGDYSSEDIIRIVTENQEKEFDRLNLQFRSLWGRRLQFIDCQNLFCEVDKYCRVAHPSVRGFDGRTRIKQKFTANRQPIHYWFPPKWRINESIPFVSQTPEPLRFAESASVQNELSF